MDFRERFAGFWRLQSLRREGRSEVTYPFGEHASGVIVYHSSGLMSVSIFRDPMAFFTPADSFDPREEPPFQGEASGSSRETLEEVFQSSLCYFGTYSVDSDKRTVEHHVIGSNRPSFVNRRLVRAFEFTEDTLLLRTPSVGDASTSLLWNNVRPEARSSPPR